MADGLLNKASIILTPTGYKAGTLYNVAPVVEPYEDFDFARASVASRVNSSGLVEMVGRTLGSELVTNGDFSNGTTEWSSGNSTLSVVDGKLKVLATGAFSYARQNITVVSGKVYKITANFFYNSLVGNIEAYDGTTNIISEQLSEDGVITLYVTPSSTSLRLTLLNRNGSSGDFNYWDNVSVKEIIDTNNIPRISYDSNGDNGHILLEPTSTNLITYSEDFSDSSWDLDFAASYITIIPNAATSPSGENNATKLIGNDVSRDPTNSYIGASTSASAPYSASIFAKKGEYDYLVLGVGSYGGGYYAIFNLSNGTISTSPTASGTTASIEDYDNGWYRCIISTTNTSGSELLFTTPSVDGTLTTDYTNTTNGVYVWGAQLEELSYATSYIPTLTGSQEVRATETATGAGSADLINSTEGVLYAEIAALADDLSNRMIALSDSDSTDHVRIYYTNSTNKISVAVKSNGSNQYVFLNHNVTDITNFIKIAVKYKANDFATFINGVKVNSQTTTASAPIGLDRLNFDSGAGVSDFYGKCKALAVFKEALSDAELNNLTG